MSLACVSWSYDAPRVTGMCQLVLLAGHAPRVIGVCQLVLLRTTCHWHVSVGPTDSSRTTCHWHQSVGPTDSSRTTCHWHVSVGPTDRAHTTCHWQKSVGPTGGTLTVSVYYFGSVFIVLHAQSRFVILTGPSLVVYAQAVWSYWRGHLSSYKSKTQLITLAGHSCVHGQTSVDYKGRPVTTLHEHKSVNQTGGHSQIYMDINQLVILSEHSPCYMPQMG